MTKRSWCISIFVIILTGSGGMENRLPDMHTQEEKKDPHVARVSISSTRAGLLRH
jgi:hypothetical protein